MTMTFDVLVAGGAGVDTIVRVEDLVIPPGDAVCVPPIREHVGHPGNGVALGLHALGVRTKFIDYIGDDAQGRLLRATYEAVGLDISALPAPAGTPRSVNLVDRQGRRFSFFDGRHPPGLRMPASFAAPHVERAGHVHVARAEPVRGLFALARAAGRTVSTDLQAWDGVDQGAWDFAYQADLVFMSGEAVHGREAEVAADVIGRGRAAVVVIMDGANGCRVRLRGLSALHHLPAVEPNRPVVDSNGAGDAFVSAFLHNWLSGDTLAEALLAGLVSGAFACGSHGTHEEQISAEQLVTAKDQVRTAALSTDGWTPLQAAQVAVRGGRRPE